MARRNSGNAKSFEATHSGSSDQARALRRSPIGELVFHYRQRLHLTQLDLAVRASSPLGAGLDSATVSERTVSSIEKLVRDDEPWNRPRPSTVRALAAAFGIGADTPEYTAFIAAATLTSQHRQASQSTRTAGASASADQRNDDRAIFVAAGRETPLQRVDEVIRGAVAGRSGLLFVAANPGTGKTSLIAQACLRAADEHPGLVTLWGECSARLGSPDTYQPFRQILGLLAGDIEIAGSLQRVSDANAEAIANRVNDALRTITIEGKDVVGRILPSGIIAQQVAANMADPTTLEQLTEILHTPRTIRTDVADLHSQVERVLTGYARLGPTIVVIEDLHWADLHTAALLFQLSRRLRDLRVPLAIIGTYRPAELPPGENGGDHPMVDVLREAPRYFEDPVVDLSTAVGGAPGREFVDAYLDQVIGHDIPQLREDLFIRTAGLPLFVVSLLRWYRDSGALTINANGQVSFDPRQSPDHLPMEINEVFAALMTQLRPGLLQVLRAGSIEGSTFTAEITMDVVGLSPDQLMEIVDSRVIQRSGVIEQLGVSRVNGRRVHQYGFTHALLRDYLYQHISAFEQEALHLRTGEAMLHHFGDLPHEASHQIAHHFELGGRLDQAARLQLRAGEFAMANLDYESARHHFHRTIDLASQAGEAHCRAQGWVGLGNCARGEGQVDEAMQSFDHALALARRDRQELAIANSLTSRAMLDYDMGNPKAGTIRLTEACTLLNKHGDEIEACRALGLLTHTLLAEGRYDDAMNRAQQSLALAERHGLPWLTAYATNAIGNCHYETANYSAARECFQQCLDQARAGGNTYREAVSLSNYVVTCLAVGDLDAAGAASAACIAIRGRVITRLHGTLRYNEGLVAEAGGDLTGARRAYRSSLDHRTAHQQEALCIDSAAGLLRIATAEHKPQSMRVSLLDLERRIRERGLDGVEYPVSCFLARANAHLALGERNRAWLLAGEGLEFVQVRSRTIADPTARTRYLERVPVHQQLRNLLASLHEAPG